MDLLLPPIYGSCPNVIALISLVACGSAGESKYESSPCTTCTTTDGLYICMLRKQGACDCMEVWHVKYVEDGRKHLMYSYKVYYTFVHVQIKGGKNYIIMLAVALYLYKWDRQYNFRWFFMFSLSHSYTK